MRFVPLLRPRGVRIPLRKLLRMLLITPFFGDFALLELLALLLCVAPLRGFDEGRIYD